MAQPESVEEPTSTYIACRHGWLHIEGDHDPSIWPVCSRKRCSKQAQWWHAQNNDSLVSQSASDTDAQTSPSAAPEDVTALPPKRPPPARCDHCGGTGVVKGTDCWYCEGNGAEQPIDVGCWRSEVLELDASTATALDGDSPASPASEVATHVSRDDEPTPRLMPLWRGLGDVLTQRLITCGLITWGDTPHEVAVDTSIEDIAAVVPLTVDDAVSLRHIGFHSGTIMLRLSRANPGGRQRWCTPGGELTDGERPEHAALRETCEELLSMPDDLASAYATALLARDSGELTGPFGSTERHHAYILCRLLGNVDDLVATFTPNDEVDAAYAVPLSAIKGSALTIELDGTSLQLRDKIGYMRMQAAHALCAADPSMVGHSPDLAVITPAARTTGLLGGARGDRNHDWMLTGARVRKLVRSYAAGARLIATEYLVIGVDMVQQHAYDVEDLSGSRLKTDLVRKLMREPDETLERRGQWQMLQHQTSIVPLHPTAFFCVKCTLQSSRAPCVLCCGSDSEAHVLLSGMHFNELADAQGSQDSEQPEQAAAGTALKSNATAIGASSKAPPATRRVSFAPSVDIIPEPRWSSEPTDSIPDFYELRADTISQGDLCQYTGKPAVVTSVDEYREYCELYLTSEDAHVKELAIMQSSDDILSNGIMHELHSPPIDTWEGAACMPTGETIQCLRELAEETGILDEYERLVNPMRNYNASATEWVHVGKLIITHLLDKKARAAQATTTTPPPTTQWRKLSVSLRNRLSGLGLHLNDNHRPHGLSDVAAETIEACIPLRESERQQLEQLGCTTAAQPEARVHADTAHPATTEEATKSETPPPPEPPAIGWCACNSCTNPVYPGERSMCDYCWKPQCMHSCMCVCTCEAVEASTWQPQASSIANRLSSHAKTIASSATAASPPQRFSESAFMAKSAGHYLTVSAAGTPGGKAPWKLLPPPPPSPAPHRSVRDITHDTDASLFPGEHRLPLPAGLAMPNVTHHAFYEHTGHIREGWRALGYTSASIADRPTQIPPSEGCYHFIGQVYDYVQLLARHGLRIYAQTSHVECGPSAWASWRVWPEKIKDGRLLQAAEELLWVTCIGERAFSEHPHTAHEHLIGPPTQVTNANQHGGSDKTWCIWSRCAGTLMPTDVVPVAERTNVLSSVTGDRDVRMLRRSATHADMANAIVSSIDRFHSDDIEDRPANQPCASYSKWRRAMHHNYGILAASYAPVLTATQLGDTTRTAPLAILIPIAPSASGPIVMVPLRGGTIFGVALDATGNYKAQAESASQFISLGIETHHMHGMDNAAKDIVIAVPWDVTPVTHVTSQSQLARAASSNMPAIWANADALSSSPAFEAVMFAIQRLTAMGGAVTHDYLNVGVWNKARPVILRQRARHYGTLPADPHIEKKWQLFLENDRLRGAEMQRDLVNVDRGTGLTASIVADVRTAADYAAELPVPPQGLPDFSDPTLLLLPAPQRPLPLHTDWLHRLPPQQVPEGFTRLHYKDALRQWARRMIADNKNNNMRYDSHCLTHGDAQQGCARPADCVLGRGAGKLIAFHDGVGTFNALDLMLETGDDGYFYPFDFTRPDRRLWVFEVVKKYIGATTNQEIMSFFFHGVRWKIKAPTQIRLLHNLQRLDTRMAKVNKKLRSLTAKGYISAHPICKVKDGIDLEGPNPFLYLFEWDCGLGGTDKPGQPDAARIVGDMTAPYGARERNKPDGEADGPEVTSFNDLSGPKGGVTPDFIGDAPFPHPEVKPRPRHKYTACAYLSYYAFLNGTFLVSFDDDQVDCFFQYRVEWAELPLCRWNIVDTIDDTGEHWYVAYRVYTMNQGGRNSSKIACDGNEEWLDAWRRQVDAFVVEWMPRQTAALQEAYAERRQKLGHEQARPFWAACYTDNFDATFCSSILCAEATKIWRGMNGEANMLMQPRIAYGTCNDWIGGRYVLNGGFGCVNPSKKARAIEKVQLSLQGSLTRELFEKNNSFLVHIADICDWPADALKGIYGPLKRPGFDTDLVVMTPIAAAKLRAVLVLLRTRPLASFWSGVTDAFEIWSGSGDAQKSIRVHAFDTCTDPSPTASNPNPSPHVAGMVDGLWWRYKLTGEWRDRHITLTEAIGPAIGALKTVPLFPDDINVLASDATAAAAAGIDKAAAEDLQAMRLTLKEEPIFQQHAHTTWHKHWKGWGNGIVDLISRDDLPMASRLAHAFGIKLRELDLTGDEAVHRFLQRTLSRTRPSPQESYQIFIKGHDGATITIDVGAKTTVAQTLEQYLFSASIDNAECHLSKQGKQLDLTATMLQSDVTKGDTLHAVLRVRAGMQRIPTPPSPLAIARESPHVGSPGSSSTHRQAVCKSATSSPSKDLPPSQRILANVPPSPPRTPLRGAADPPTPRSMLRDVAEVPATVRNRAGSPQPLTARAARAVATRRTAVVLAADDTEYAICRDDPIKLTGLLTHIAEAKVSGIAKGTAAADEWGFRWATLFGQDTNTRWMTPPINNASINPVTERWRTAVCLFWIAQHMAPSARRRQQGFGSAKPSSSLLAVYGWRRVLRDCDRYLSDMVQVRAVLKGICALVKQQYGLGAFAVHQAKVYSLKMLLDVAEALRTRPPAQWQPSLVASWYAQHTWLTVIGERKEGWTEAHAGDDNIRRANFNWLDTNGEPLPMTISIIDSRHNGCILRATVGASKCDRLCITWANQKQYFRYDDNNPLCFAVAFQRWELAYPCPISKRSEWPAFSPYGNHVPFTPSVATTTHAHLMIHALGAEEAVDLTIHSYRATLINAMFVAKAAGHTQFTEGIMQAHVRHKTLDAMYGYGKLLPSAYADNLAIISTTDASGARRDMSIEFDPTNALASVEASIDAIGEPKAVTAEPSPRHRPLSPTAPPTPPRATRPQRVRPPPPTPATMVGPVIEIVGNQRPIATYGTDSWRLLGSTVNLPNALWNEGSGTTACTITHFLHKHLFPDGTTHIGYAVSIANYEGLYAVQAETIARHVDKATRHRLRKQPPPKPLIAQRHGKTPSPLAPSMTPPPSPPPSPESPTLAPQPISLQQTIASTPFRFHELQIVVAARNTKIYWHIRNAASEQFSRETDKLYHSSKHAINWRAYIIWRVYVSTTNEWLCPLGFIKTSEFDDDASKQACLLIAVEIESEYSMDAKLEYWQQNLHRSSNVIERQSAILEVLGYIVPINTPFDDASVRRGFDTAVLSVVELDCGLWHDTAKIAKAANWAAGQRNTTAANMLAILAFIDKREREYDYMFPPNPPTSTPPPSPPPTPGGGDTYGTRRKSRASSWGSTDKTGKERARRDKWKRLAKAFEKQALMTPHPQECPVCMDAEKCCLMIDCGNEDMPWHRGHGLCLECATLIIEGRRRCPLCGMPVHDYINMGTEFFVQ